MKLSGDRGLEVPRWDLLCAALRVLLTLLTEFRTPGRGLRACTPLCAHLSLHIWYQSLLLRPLSLRARGCAPGSVTPVCAPGRAHLGVTGGAQARAAPAGSVVGQALPWEPLRGRVGPGHTQHLVRNPVPAGGAALAEGTATWKDFERHRTSFP